MAPVQGRWPHMAMFVATALPSFSNPTRGKAAGLLAHLHAEALLLGHTRDRRHKADEVDESQGQGGGWNAHKLGNQRGKHAAGKHTPGLTWLDLETAKCSRGA